MKVVEKWLCRSGWYKLHLSAAFREVFLPGWCQLTQRKSSLTCSTTLSQFELDIYRRWTDDPIVYRIEGYDFSVDAIHFSSCLFTVKTKNSKHFIQERKKHRLISFFIYILIWFSHNVFCGWFTCFSWPWKFPCWRHKVPISEVRSKTSSKTSCFALWHGGVHVSLDMCWSWERSVMGREIFFPWIGMCSGLLR